MQNENFSIGMVINYLLCWITMFNFSDHQIVCVIRYWLFLIVWWIRKIQKQFFSLYLYNLYQSSILNQYKNYLLLLVFFLNLAYYQFLFLLKFTIVTYYFHISFPILYQVFFHLLQKHISFSFNIHIFHLWKVSQRSRQNLLCDCFLILFSYIELLHPK